MTTREKTLHSPVDCYFLLLVQLSFHVGIHVQVTTLIHVSTRSDSTCIFAFITSVRTIVWFFSRKLHSLCYLNDIAMDTTTSGANFSDVALGLNTLDRSRADQRLLNSYKCPCNVCKGGGRPIFRTTIERHLLRHGRDPTLLHCMLVSASVTKLLSSSFQLLYFCSNVCFFRAI